jgi:hypothetical protein
VNIAPNPTLVVLCHQNRIVNTYLAWKKKQRLSAIIQGWRHFALYGKIDALYSRQMLMNSLSEQRVLSGSMERFVGCIRVRCLRTWLDSFILYPQGTS